jgi:hypothetical protein
MVKNELSLMVQRDRVATQYFHKVKSLPHDISEFDPQTLIGEIKMKWITVLGYYILFGYEDVKIFRVPKIISTRQLDFGGGYVIAPRSL